MTDGSGPVVLTLDVDWVTDEVLAHVLGRLRDRDVRATVFATHETDVLIDGVAQMEVGLHPNFESSPFDFDSALRVLKRAYPEAIGGRSHGLYTSSRILALYREHGLRYESNVFLFRHPHLRPTLRFEGLTSVPFFWSDDKHLELGLPHVLDSLRLDLPGMKVLNFHPIHVFMNTTSEEHYARYKPLYRDTGGLRAHVAPGPGVGSLFDAVVDLLAAQQGGSSCLRDLYDGYGEPARTP